MQSAQSARSGDGIPSHNSIRFRPWLAFLIFAVVGFGIYAPALNGEKIWDDHYLIGENPLFRSPAFAGEVFKHHLFFESQSTYYRPVQNLSYIADYWFWAERTLGYHITNVLLHVMAAWLLWLLLRKILPGLRVRQVALEWTAFCVALVWLVHPIHNAAVAYIAGRADSLAAMFSLGAWLAFLRMESLRFKADAVRKWAFATLTVVLLLLALCSKEIALVWVLLFAIHRIGFVLETPVRRRLAPVVCAIAVVGVYAWLHSLPPPRPPQPVAISEGIGGRAIVALRALGDYSGLIAWPSKLMMERSLGSDAAAFRLDRLSVLGLSALGLALWLSLKAGSGRRLRCFGALWFAVAFIPISNLIPLNAQVAEHWIYLASIGAFLFLAGCVGLIGENRGRVCVMAVLTAAAALGVRTAFRAADWSNAEAFARSTIASGGGTARMHAYLAQELGNQGRLVEQEQVLRKTVALYPDYVTARVNLGICLQRQGRADEAGSLLQPSDSATAPTAPRTWNAALNTADALFKSGKSDAALALLREWRARFPETWELAAEEATILADTEGPAAALAVVREYADAHWWHLPSRLGLAGFQRQTSAFEDARQSATEAAALDVHGAEAFAELARIEAAAGKFTDAIEAAATAVARRPDNADYYTLLGGLFEAAGRPKDAALVRQKAESLRR